LQRQQVAGQQVKRQETAGSNRMEPRKTMFGKKEQQQLELVHFTQQN
jgi:hypothetical protein